MVEVDRSKTDGIPAVGAAVFAGALHPPSFQLSNQVARPRSTWGLKWPTGAAIAAIVAAPLSFQGTSCRLTGGPPATGKPTGAACRSARRLFGEQLTVAECPV